MITVGISKVAGINYAMLEAIGPIFLFSTSIFILREKFRPRILIGSIVALIGISLIILSEDRAGADVANILVGNALVIGALLMDTVATIIGKHLASEMDPKNVAGFSLAWNALIYSAVLAFTSHGINFIEIDARSWTLLIVSGIFLVLVPWVLYYVAIKNTAVENLSIFLYISPIFATLGSVVILGESFTLSLALGAVLVFGGLWLSQHKAKIFWFHIRLPHKYISPLHLHLIRSKK